MSAFLCGGIPQCPEPSEYTGCPYFRPNWGVENHLWRKAEVGNFFVSQAQSQSSHPGRSSQARQEHLDTRAESRRHPSVNPCPVYQFSCGHFALLLCLYSLIFPWLVICCPSIGDGEKNYSFSHSFTAIEATAHIQYLWRFIDPNSPTFCWLQCFTEDMQ